MTDKKTTNATGNKSKKNNKTSTSKNEVKKKNTVNTNKKGTEIQKNTNKQPKKGNNLKNKNSKEIVKEQVKIEIVGRELKNKNKMSKESCNKVYKLIIPNIYIAIGVIIYYIFMTLGFYNINNSVFITDIKAFSVAWMVIAIIMFEQAYKKSSSKFMLYGIELLMLTIATVSLIYINLMWADKYAYITSIISLIFAIYCIVKCTIIYKINKEKFFINRMKEIIDKDNKEDE